MKKITINIDLSRPVQAIENYIKLSLDIDDDEIDRIEEKLLIGYFKEIDRLEIASPADNLFHSTHWIVRQDLGMLVIKYMADYPTLRFKIMSKLIGLDHKVVRVRKTFRNSFEVYCDYT